MSLLFVLAIIFLINPGQPAAAETNRTLKVINQSFVIEYGEKITVSGSIDATGISVDTADAEAVRALFRPLGGDTIWSYSYPEYELSLNGQSGDNRIDFSFDIPTGPGSYYPPGVEFNIEFEITDTSETRTRVSLPEPIEYLDPAHDWERVPGNGYTVVYYGVDRDRVDQLVETIDFRIPTLEATTGMTDPPHFKAVVFPSIPAATPSFPPVSQTATDQRIFAGFAQPQYRLFVQGQMNTNTFTHELAHLYTHEATSSAIKGGIPSWLDEGLARFLESGSSERSNERLRASVDPDELLSLAHMQTIPGQARSIAIFYPQAGAFVGYLVEQYSHGHMADLLSMLNKGRSLGDAFEIVFDLPLHQAENNWRSLFNAPALPVPSATVESGAATETLNGTPVPLIDYESLNTGESTEASGTPLSTNPVQITPTATPTFAAPDVDEPSPDWAVAAVVIGLSTIVGIWLFTSRRRMPKRKS